MNRTQQLIIFLLLTNLQFILPKNTLNQSHVFSMESLEEVSLHEGLAGTTFGKHGSSFIMAGGSYFPEGKPWQNGKKHFSDQVFVFNNAFELIHTGNHLPAPIAEAAFVSLPGGLLTIGGQTPEGLSADVFLISYINNIVTTTPYPNLPIPVRNASAAVLGSKIYLLGGELADGSSTKQFLALDLNQFQKGWQQLPEFPMPISGATLTPQQDGEEMALFAIGGRAKTDINPTIFYSTVFHYSPTVGAWKQRRDIQTKNFNHFPIAMASASTVGATHILLYGGDIGHTYNLVEKALAENQLHKRDSLWQHHPGFNNQLLIYNTVTDVWHEAGATKQTPVAVMASFSDGRNIYIAGGEKSPGIRSPFISKISFSSSSSFGWLNYAVLLLYFAGMLLLGFFFMKRNENTEDFFKASGRIPWWAAGISIFATSLSAITFLSIPAKTYATDWRMLLFNISIILIVPIVIRYFLPFFRRFNFSTAYAYLEARFSRTVRWLASTLFVFFMISRIAIVLFLPSLALNAVTGFDIYISIIIMGIVTIIYSTSGGMEAVVWGDVIQGFILVFGAISALIFMIIGIEGGLSEFWTTTISFHKFQTFDFRFDFTQPAFWVVVIGGVINSLIMYTSDQSIVQRYMSTKDEKATSRSIWLNGILSVPVTLLFFLIGTGLFAFYSANPGNMTFTNANIDSVFPQFIVTEMPVGLAGLLVAAVFAAAMSTLSSNINSSAAVITADFLHTISKKDNNNSHMQLARWSGIAVGLLGMGMALILATWNIASLWDQFNTFLGLLTSGLGALFTLGIFFPRVGSKAALLGVITGLITLIIIKNNTTISFLLYGLIGMASGIISSYIYSFILPNKKVPGGYTWKEMSGNK